jgi:hypothetical protein
LASGLLFQLAQHDAMQAIRAREVIMEQEMLELDYGSDFFQANQVRPREPRPLTYDESKAAEAAFQGLPFNPSWSAAALVVYHGIMAAMATR